MASSALSITVNGLPAIIHELQSLAEHGGLVKAGILEGSGNYQEVIEYAPIQEFGGRIPVTKKMRGYLAANYGIHLKADKEVISIPSRPFMRRTYQRNWRKWADRLGLELTHGIPVKQALEHVGMMMQDDIIETLKSNMAPANSAMTQMIKEKDAPAVADQTLQHTGTLIHSIMYEVTPE